MNALAQSQTRHASFSLASALDADAKDELTATLLSIEGVSELSVSDRGIDIEYLFPLACFADVHAGLLALAREDNFKTIRSWRYRLRAFTEANERAHIQAAADWYRYSRDIYLHYQALGEARQANAHQQLWRRQQQTRRSARVHS